MKITIIINDCVGAGEKKSDTHPAPDKNKISRMTATKFSPDGVLLFSREYIEQTIAEEERQTIEWALAEAEHNRIRAVERRKEELERTFASQRRRCGQHETTAIDYDSIWQDAMHSYVDRANVPGAATSWLDSINAAASAPPPLSQEDVTYSRDWLLCEPSAPPLQEDVHFYSAERTKRYADERMECGGRRRHHHRQKDEWLPKRRRLRKANGRCVTFAERSDSAVITIDDADLERGTTTTPWWAARSTKACRPGPSPLSTHIGLRRRHKRSRRAAEGGVGTS